MAKVTQQVDAKDYGDATQEAQDADALAATAAMEAETTPQLAAPEAETTQEQPVPEQEASAAAAPGVIQPRNLMQLVPPSLLFRQQSSRLPSQQDYDVGQLWRALEQDQNTDPLVRAIAKKLLREA